MKQMACEQTQFKKKKKHHPNNCSMQGVAHEQIRSSLVRLLEGSSIVSNFFLGEHFPKSVPSFPLL